MDPPTGSVPNSLTWAAARRGVPVVGSEQVQSLWGGYGRIVRVRFADGSTRIVKEVEPPPGEGIGHERKLRSYAVEHAFYALPPSVPRARTAACDGVHFEAGHVWFLLEDLDAAGFAGRRHRLSGRDADACLRWLAAFHGAHLGEEPQGLWPVGTYWHLATRPDELAAMAQGALKDAASALDAALNEARFQTWVHGDAKPANFCFGPAGVAAVDFQYVGGGVGVKDVAYLLGCLSDAELQANGDALLDRYFELLGGALSSAIDAAAVEAEWRALFPTAWADFARFLAGWAPGRRDGAYGQGLTNQALAAL